MATSAMMRRGAIGIMAAAATVLAGVAQVSAAPPTGSYAALGDSYAAGANLYPLAPGSSLLCSQSAAMNYPKLVAQSLGLALTDATCSGARAVDMAQAQYPGVPPQFSALKPDTRIVTLTLSINDDNEMFLTNYLGCPLIFASLASSSGTPCKDAFASSTSAGIPSDAANIARALQQIHTLSPNARVFVVGYPAILPEQGNCPAQMPLTTGDVAYLSGVERELNAMLQSQANANDAVFVDLYTPSRRHDMCQPAGVRWVEPLFGANGLGVVHPNAAGHQAFAKIIEAAINNS